MLKAFQGSDSELNVLRWPQPPELGFERVIGTVARRGFSESRAEPYSPSFEYGGVSFGRSWTLLTRTTAKAVSFRKEAEREIRDLGDPRVAGWTFLVNPQDPQLDSIVKILRPLAQHRNMADPSRPLMYRGELQDQWFQWTTRRVWFIVTNG